MDHHLLCSWLGLPADNWPPNHFVLLGLEPGPVDAAAVEASVQDRMAILRRYQLTHPELATEAMNRLAQALVCLTDPIAKPLIVTGAVGYSPPLLFSFTVSGYRFFHRERVSPN